MAFFKFRWPLGGASKGRDERPPSGAQAESVEVLRRRARHRLIGSAVLVLAGVLGFPLLFDTQPRPIPIDIPIVIPDKNKVPALAVPTTGPAPSGIAADEEVVPAADRRDNRSDAKAMVAAAEPRKDVPKAEVKAEPKPEAKAERKPEPKPEHKGEAKPEHKADTKADPKSEARAPARPEPKVEAKVESKPEAKSDKSDKSDGKSDDAARARALLEGKVAPEAAAAAAADANRFIVQVGAFSDVNKAREARLKLEKAGLKTYTQVVDTADGKRIRVRVGPFAGKAEADKAAGRIKSLDLPASILTL